MINKPRPGISKLAGFRLAVDQMQGIGSGVLGNAVTDILYVSPNGDGSNGSSWARAYQTIQDALDAAPTDGDLCTLILISPHTTQYDINTTGDPTWSANVILKGTHRTWTKIVNTHASATSIMKLTGKVTLIDLYFDLGTGSGNGIIMTHEGCRGYNLQFNGESLTGLATALNMVGASNLKFCKFSDIHMVGHASFMSGLKLDKCSRGLFERFRIYDCLTGVQITDAVSDYNLFHFFDIGDSAIGFDIDAGNKQHFEHITLHHNTVNFDDEIGDHIYSEIIGSFPKQLLPDNFTGVTLATHANPNTWGNDTEILAAAGRDKPFIISGISIEADATEKFRVRLSADSGSTHFIDIQLEGTANANKRESVQFPSGSEYIFNHATRISGSAKSESGSNNAVVWLEIQEI